MPRERKGTIERAKDGSRLRIRITVEDNFGRTRRPWVDIDPAYSDDDARELASRVSREMHGKPWDPQLAVRTRKIVGTLTCDQYCWKLYRPTRIHAVKTIDDDDGRWKEHLKPLIFNLPVDALTKDVLRDVVETLDKKAKDPKLRTGRNRFGAKTARNVWSVLTTMTAEMEHSKVRALRVLEQDPAVGVQPPDSPLKVSKQWLYPVELQQLLACPAVPLARRRLYAVAVYCYTRPGETLALLWGRSVDLDHGMLRVNRSYDSDQGSFVEHTKPMIPAISRSSRS